MKVKDFMIKDVVTVRTNDTIKDVMKVMVEKKIGGMPMVDEDGKLQGIVTDGDILRAIKPIDRRVQDYFSFIMYVEEEDMETRLREVADKSIVHIGKTHGLVTVHPEEEMKKVVLLLSKHHFKKLPVVDKNHRVVGVISRGDAIRNIQQTILHEWK